MLATVWRCGGPDITIRPITGGAIILILFIGLRRTTHMAPAPGIIRRPARMRAAARCMVRMGDMAVRPLTIRARADIRLDTPRTGPTAQPLPAASTIREREPGAAGRW